MLCSLFIIVINEKQPKYPQQKKKKKQLKKLLVIPYSGNHTSNKKQQSIEIQDIGLDHKGIRLSGKSQSQKIASCMISFIQHSWEITKFQKWRTD